MKPPSTGLRWARKLVAALTAACVGACSTLPRPPPAFELAAAEFAAGSTAPDVVIDAPSGKWAGAGWGALKGAGIGGLVGLASEVGCTFVCGAATVVGTLLGGAVGAIVGAVTSEGAEAVQAKQQLFAAAVAHKPVTAQLTELLRAQAPVGPSPGVAAAWQVTVTIEEAGSEGSGVDKPYAVRLLARLDIRRAGDAAPATPLHFSATSTTVQTTAEWGASDAAPLHAALDQCVRSLAAQMLTALRAPGPPRAAQSIDPLERSPS